MPRRLFLCLLPSVAIAAAIALLATGAHAASRVAITADAVDWQGVRIHQAELVLSAPGRKSASATFYAAAVDGLATGTLGELRLSCASLDATGDRLQCRRGHLSGDFGAIGVQDTPVELGFEPGGRLDLRATQLGVAGGRVALHARLAGDTFRASGTLAEVDLGKIRPVVEPLDLLPAGLALGGLVSGEFETAGVELEPLSFAGSFALAGLAFSDEAGAMAGEQVDATLAVGLSRPSPRADWDLGLDARSERGQVYVEPVFADLAQHPITAGLEGTLTADAARLVVGRLRLEQSGVVTASGSAELDLAAAPMITTAHVVLERADLAGAIPMFASPFLISTQFSDLAGSGSVRGEIDIASGLPTRVDLTLEDVVLDSTSGSLAVNGLDGSINWHDEALRNRLAPTVDSETFKSRIDWRSARLWGIEFGPAGIPFTATGRGFRLLDPVLLPVFDGGLAIEALRLRNAGTPEMYLRFDAVVAPISVAPIARALGLPEFSGTLAGRIPRLELADGLVTLGGNIEAQVFDGLVTVRNLSLRDPLGQFPRLFADIDVDGLDLEQLTNTFEFGMITGRLSGRVAGLETFDWMPVAFDAKFYSTPGDRTKRRISQRAVQNLSSIGGGSGGGVAAALQGGFLRFFDSFRYRELGLSCRLENDVCRMDGVAPAPGGYYIVRGSGLPRIDVIGNQTRVAWSRLVSQLAAMAETSGPVVE